MAPESEDEEQTPPSTDASLAGDATDDVPLTSLRDIKAKYVDGGGSTDDADTDTRDRRAGGRRAPLESQETDETDRRRGRGRSAEAGPEDQKPKPASSGETHQPRTDAEIGEGGSLFDL